MPGWPSCSSTSPGGWPPNEAREPEPILDGHNDALLALARNAERPDSLLERSVAWPSRPAARQGGRLRRRSLRGVHPGAQKNADRDAMMAKPQYDVPLPEQSELTYAQATAFEMISLLFRIARRSEGAARITSEIIGGVRRSIGQGARDGAPHRGRRADRPRFDASKCSTRRGCARSGPSGAGPTFWPRRAVPLPELARHGPRPDREGRALVKACNELGSSSTFRI